MNFNFPFKNRKEIKRGLIVLKRAAKMHGRLMLVADEDKRVNKVVVYPYKLYSEDILRKIYNDKYITFNQSLMISYCEHLLKHNKIFSFNKYLTGVYMTTNELDTQEDAQQNGLDRLTSALRRRRQQMNENR